LVLGLLKQGQEAVDLLTMVAGIAIDLLLHLLK
jgi:hypothetical protein